VTKLNELAMPLIRYAMDDFATDGLQNCSCGRGYPTIARVHGKTLSVIRCTDGTAIAAQAFVLLLDYQPVRKYQVVQEADYSINLRLVPGDGYDDTVEAKILSLIRHVVGDLPVRIQRCSDIPMTPSGKLLPVISHVTVGESKGKPS
jgi:phenylacetate-CoA ligase